MANTSAAEYRDLGPTQLLTAVPGDLTNPYGINNWVITAQQKDLNVYVAQAEIYQIYVDGPVGSTFKMYRNSRQWNIVLQGWANNYDPTETIYVRPGDAISFYWNSTRLPIPTAILWLRYDISLPENQVPGGPS